VTTVFVHGNPEVDALWGPLVDALAGHGVDDVVLLSPPGFGAPTPPGWRATRQEYVDWLIGRLEEIGGEIDLVGHDWGAGHVYGVLAERPELVRSYAADVAGMLHADYVWHDAARAWQTPEVGEQFIEGMLAAGAEGRATALAAMGMSPEIAGVMAAAMDAEMGRCILALYRDAEQAIADVLPRLVAGDLPPGLIIDPTEDPYVSSELGREVARALGARELRLDGLGHWWMTTDPGRAADGLVEFWSTR
jgi:pimeloyl-ACP methyl ester carboxylesterase